MIYQMDGLYVMNWISKAGVINGFAETAVVLIEPQLTDPAHVARILAIAEATRLVSDAAVINPRFLRSPEFDAFVVSVFRLAEDLRDPAAHTVLFADVPELFAIEKQSGALSAAMFGLAGELDSIGVELGRQPALRGEDAVGSIIRLVRLPRAEYDRCACLAVPLLGALESQILPAATSPFLARECWNILLGVSFALAHMSDTTGVEAPAATACIASNLASLARATLIAQSSNDSDAIHLFGDLARAVNAMEMTLVVAAAQREANHHVLCWRVAASGRAALPPDDVDFILCRAAPASAFAAELRAAAEAVRAEWAAA